MGNGGSQGMEKSFSFEQCHNALLLWRRYGSLMTFNEIGEGFWIITCLCLQGWGWKENVFSKPTVPNPIRVELCFEMNSLLATLPAAQTHTPEDGRRQSAGGKCFKCHFSFLLLRTVPSIVSETASSWGFRVDTRVRECSGWLFCCLRATSKVYTQDVRKVLRAARNVCLN